MHVFFDWFALWKHLAVDMIQGQRGGLQRFNSTMIGGRVAYGEGKGKGTMTMISQPGHVMSLDAYAGTVNGGTGTVMLSGTRKIFASFSQLECISKYVHGAGAFAMGMWDGQSRGSRWQSVLRAHANAALPRIPHFTHKP